MITRRLIEAPDGRGWVFLAILVLIILFIQKRPRGLFALKGRAVEA